MKKNILTFVATIILLSVAGTAAAADNELEAFKKAIRAKYDIKEMAFAN